MKKFIILLLIGLFIIPISVFAEEEKSELLKNATSGLLMEQTTGEIIFEKDKDKKVAVASMTKMVAQTIILENIESGKIKWDDIVKVSKNAADMGGSQIYLTANEKMSVKDLFKGISMASANDATVAMAEYIAGTEQAFVKQMNKKVKELGLKNTQFKNATGLDEDGHYSSAYDMAVIARNLLNHEEILEFSSVYEDYLREDTENKFWLVNTNKLLRFYTGIDGLKTGYTDKAGYCLTATMERNNMRLLSIVMGADTKDNRSTDTISMMEYGYSSYGTNTILNKNKYSGTIKINNAKKRKVKYYLNDDVKLVVKKGTKDVNYKIDKKLYNVKAPLKKNSKVGKLIVTYENKKYEYDLIVREDVKKSTYLNTVKNNLKDVITGSLTK